MDILRDIGGENSGGIKTLLFADWNSQLNYVANGFANFMSSISWNIMQYTKDTCKFQENFKKSPEGNIFEVSIAGIFPKNSAAVNAAFNSMTNKRFVLGIQDNNNNWIFVGDRNTGANFFVNTQIEDKFSGKNGYEFTFNGRFRTKTPFFIYEQGGITINNALLVDNGVYLDYGSGVLLYT